MVTDLSNLTNTTSVSDLFIYANQSSDYTLSLFFMIAFFVVLFFSFKKVGSIKSMAISGFLCGMVSLFLYSSGFITNFYYILVFFGIFAFSMLAIGISGD